MKKSLAIFSVIAIMLAGIALSFNLISKWVKNNTIITWIWNRVIGSNQVKIVDINTGITSIQ